MCVVGRKVLIHGEARKNKSRRKKYFVLNCCDNYTKPRLDYFTSIDKWSQNHRNEVYSDVVDGSSFRFIDLCKLFFVDDVRRAKPKLGGLDLYMEDSHVTLTFESDDVKNRWKDIFDNVVYKNGKIRAYPKIEHTLQVGLRFKPKENIDKALLMQLKGDFRVCFMKTSLMFVNKSLENPDFTMEYQFIRKLESRFDGTFRLDIGRAAPIGECQLIMQLADYSESNAAHAMLINCTKSFKLSLPEPVRIRGSMSRVPDRRSSVSSCRAFSARGSVTGVQLRPESCAPCPGDASSVIRYQIEQPGAGPDEYMEMNTVPDEDHGTECYFEHTSRVYRCPMCTSLTKVVTFCSRCTTTSSASSIRLLFKTEGLPNSLTSKLLPSVRSKAQSLTERPRLQSPSINNNHIRNRQCLSELTKSSQSSSKTSTTEMSSSSKLESQNSLSVSSNRHDDEIFADLYFDNSDKSVSVANHTSTKMSPPCPQLKCQNCYQVLESMRSDGDSSSSVHHCTKCYSEMVSLTMVIKESPGTAPSYNEWIPRTTSLIPSARPSTVSSTCTSEYVDTSNYHCDNITRDSHYIDNYCS